MKLRTKAEGNSEESCKENNYTDVYLIRVEISNKEYYSVKFDKNYVESYFDSDIKQEDVV